MFEDCNTWFEEPSCPSWSDEFKHGYCYAKCNSVTVWGCTEVPGLGMGIVCWNNQES